MLLPYLLNVSQNTEVLFITVVGLLNLTTNACIFNVLPMLEEIWSFTIPIVAGGSHRMENIIKNLTSFLVIIQCVLSYVLLAFHITALYPILYDDLPNLLLPWLYLTILKDIILNIISFGVGLLICRYIYGCCLSSKCINFILYKIFKIILAVYAVRSYIIFYKNLRYDEFLFNYNNVKYDYSYILNVDERVDNYRKKARSIKPFCQKHSIQISLPEGKSYIKITHSLSNTKSSEIFTLLNKDDIDDEHDLKLNNKSSNNNENNNNYIDKHDNDDDIYNFDVKLNNFGDDYPLIFNSETLIKKEIYEKNNLMKRKKASNSSTNETEINASDESDSTKSDIAKDSDESKSDQPFIITIEVVQTSDSIGTNTVEFANIYISCHFIE